jgi:glutamine synthetase
VLENMGIPVEYSFHEDAPSQHEIDLRYTDALTMADNVMTFRLVVKEIAQEQGAFATFMPKPLAGVQGSGMHTHMSLFEGDENAFHEPGDQYGLSKVARGFIAGLLHHSHEITAVTNQLVNSYKRLIAGYEAPVYVTWARNNESALVRVPVTKRGKSSSTRIEYRSPDPACNPYLAYSVMLAAGLKGIEEGYELPSETTANVFEMTPEERAAEGIRPLPQSLSDALDVMEGSELVAEALGEHIFEWFLRNKRSEWFDYKSQVTQFELDRYLPTW